jgi:tetratricopeptide (TPR) repeat protein
VVVFVAAVTGAAATGWWYARESTPHQGPIILISIDGLRPAQLPTAAGTANPTSALHALAAEAVVFERAYTHSPLTLPAHASILFGQLPFEHGVRDEAGFALRDEARSLAELLRRRDFATGAAVSSFLLRPASGVAQGFSFFDADLPERKDGAMPVVERDGAHTTDAALQWLSRQREHRFFLFVQVRESAAESTVARLVAELEAQRLYDRATIIVTAGRGDTGPSLDDASLRVPLLIKQPAAEEAGRRIALPVQHIDIVPTVLDLVRAPIPSALRGRSLRGVLTGDEDSLVDQPIYAETLAWRFRFGGTEKFALATPEHFYVRGGSEQIIDLDRGHVTADAAAPAAMRLREELDRLLEGRAVSSPTDVAAAEEDRFAALGYLGAGPLAAAKPDPIDPLAEAWIIETHRTAAMMAARKNYPAAIEHLRRIARAHPRMAIIHYQLGTLLGRIGRLEEAQAAFHAAAAVEPDSPYVPVALTRLLLRAGRVEEAQERAALALALADHDNSRARAVAHEIASQVALALGQADAARGHAAAAQQEDPAVPIPQFIEGRLLQAEGRHEDALSSFEAAAATLEQNKRYLEGVHLELGETLARLGRYAEAETHFRKELSAFPQNIRAYSSLAMLYQTSNRTSGAERVLDDLLEATPTPEGYGTAARLWTVLGEPSRAAALRAEARNRFRGGPPLASSERDAQR